MKTCIRCHETKSFDGFYTRGDGYRSECKECTKGVRAGVIKSLVGTLKRAAPVLANRGASKALLVEVMDAIELGEKRAW